MRSWRGFWSVGTGELVQHPVRGRTETLLVFLPARLLAPTREGCATMLVCTEGSDARSTTHLDGFLSVKLSRIV